MPLLASRALPLGKRGRVYSACKHYVMIYGSETGPIIDENVIRLERNDASMVTWMCNVWPEIKISAEEIRTRLKLKYIRECLNKKLKSAKSLASYTKTEGYEGIFIFIDLELHWSTRAWKSSENGIK